MKNIPGAFLSTVYIIYIVEVASGRHSHLSIL